MKKIAVFNAGSSSLKFTLFDFDTHEVLVERNIQNIGSGDGVANHEEALRVLDVAFDELCMVGHRVVHGGEHFIEPTLVDDEVIQQIQKLSFLAPLHNPANLKAIEFFHTHFPHIPQYCVFDTAFHATMPKEAYIYAIEKQLYTQHHIRRYGFHGSSHSYLLKESAKLLNKPISQLNLITLHLGNGASVCAIKNGKSIDTSMGFTPLEGLVMGQRCGDIDAGIVLHMQREFGWSVEEVDKELNKHAGLVGLCGENNVQKILTRNDEDAQLAIDVMVRRIQKYIGGYMVLLEGEVDALVFSGGIGENSQTIREKIVANKMLQHLQTLVIPTDEQKEIMLKSTMFLEK